MERRKIQGTVVSTKNDKTIVVVLSSYKAHSKYLKRVEFRSKYYAHDENNEAKEGDIVTIEECRPLSKLKRFRLVSIDQKALESIKVAEEKAVEEILEKKAEEEKVEETAPVEEAK